MSATEKVPFTSPILDYLQSLHQSFTSTTDGKVATYIPELAKANPDWFGICLVTAMGNIYEVGDSQQPFTIPLFRVRCMPPFKLTKNAGEKRCVTLMARF